MTEKPYNIKLATGCVISWIAFFIIGTFFGSNIQRDVTNIMLSPATNIMVPHADDESVQEMDHETDLRQERLFSDSEIRKIYNKYIKPKSYNQTYLRQYQWISNATWFAPEFEKRYWTHAGGTGKYFDISRIIQTASFREYLHKYDILNTHCDYVLTFNVDWDPEAQYFNGRFNETHNIQKCEHYTNLGYHPPHDTSGDLYLLDLEYKQWDIILLPQFLEHFYNDQMVMNNLYKHLRFGGYLYVSVPTVNIPHMTPFHYQHLQPMGLATLGLAAGFEIKEIDFWGTMEYIDTIYKVHYWPPYTAHRKYEPLINDPFHVAQTWGLFQKTAKNLSSNNGR